MTTCPGQKLPQFSGRDVQVDTRNGILNQLRDSNERKTDGSSSEIVNMGTRPWSAEPGFDIKSMDKVILDPAICSQADEGIRQQMHKRCNVLLIDAVGLSKLVKVGIYPLTVEESKQSCGASLHLCEELTDPGSASLLGHRAGLEVSA
jgi:hypothetical protein